MEKDKSIKVIAILEIVTALGILGFWIMFFFAGMVPENPPACYFAYEHAFPLPDSALSIGLIVAGIFLLKGKPWGSRLSLICAGGLVFLGLLDFCFNLQNGVYSLSAGELVSNGFINLWCVAFGAAVAVSFGRGR